MGKLLQLTPEYVEFIPVPDEMKEGVLYVSLQYNCTNHLCACGCKNQTPLPVNMASGWSMIIAPNKAVTLSPSIGNYQLPCKSHYYIQENYVVWL